MNEFLDKSFPKWIETEEYKYVEKDNPYIYIEVLTRYIMSLQINNNDIDNYLEKFLNIVNLLFNSKEEDVKDVICLGAISELMNYKSQYVSFKINPSKEVNDYIEKNYFLNI